MTLWHTPKFPSLLKNGKKWELSYARDSHSSNLIKNFESKCSIEATTHKYKLEDKSTQTIKFPKGKAIPSLKMKTSLKNS